MNDVIAAIATAQGLGGVAIVRLSGAGSLDIAKKMFSRKGDFTPNMLYAGTIDCGDFCDYGMCVYFRAPKSRTGCCGKRLPAARALPNGANLPSVLF